MNTNHEIDNASTTSASPTAASEKLFDGLKQQDCTTLMVRNIPNKYSQRMVLGVIHKYGFKGTFDFLYVPSDFATRVNVGYCFVNFISPKYAQDFARVFHRMHLNGFKSKKLVQISLGTTQGFDANIKKFEDSTLCSEFVAPEFHPLIFNTKTGEEIPFRSLMPGYEPDPPSRLEDPAYWAKEDKEHHHKKWEGDTIYPAKIDERQKITDLDKDGKPLPKHEMPKRDLSAFEMSPRSKALQQSRFSHRASSIGAPPGLSNGRYARHHGHGGYPLPTAEMYHMYRGENEMSYEPRRRASIGAPPGLLQQPSDFSRWADGLRDNYPYPREPPAPPSRPPAERPRW